MPPRRRCSRAILSEPPGGAAPGWSGKVSFWKEGFSSDFGAAGLADDQATGEAQDAAPFFAGQEIEQGLADLATDGLQVHVHRGQRGMGGDGDRLPVIEADDGDI